MNDQLEKKIEEEIALCKTKLKSVTQRNVYDKGKLNARIDALKWVQKTIKEIDEIEDITA